MHTFAPPKILLYLDIFFIVLVLEHSCNIHEESEISSPPLPLSLSLKKKICAHGMATTNNCCSWVHALGQPTEASHALLK